MEFITNIIHENFAIIVVALIFMVLDIISGLIKAFQTGSYDSKLMRNGLYHKIAYIIIMLVGACLEFAITNPNFDPGFQVPMFGVICGYIIVTEFFSILENVSAVNPAIGNFMSRWLKQAADANAEVEGKHGTN
jgi:toxin secretion/phage lysis holin